MVQIISHPTSSLEDSFGEDTAHGFAFFETVNYPAREAMEDALAWHPLSPQDLIPLEMTSGLSPIEIGHRLWTAYKMLDQPHLEAGSTASTTVYDGKGHFITATLADAASFVAAYDQMGKALGVLRLNSVTHKPTNDSEYLRIRSVGGVIKKGRVVGLPDAEERTTWLAISRAIGDTKFKALGLCSDASIDFIDIDQIADEMGCTKQEIKKLQIISTCDGFTDAAVCESRNAHAFYLFAVLRTLRAPADLPEADLAKILALRAKLDGSKDNITVAVATVLHDPFLIGVYDGHGGKDAACHAAGLIGQYFKALCAISPSDYAALEWSVQNNALNYCRDNQEPIAPSMMASAIDERVDYVKQLMSLGLIFEEINLKDDDGSSEQNVKQKPFSNDEMPGFFSKSISNEKVLTTCSKPMPNVG